MGKLYNYVRLCVNLQAIFLGSTMVNHFAQIFALTEFLDPPILKSAEVNVFENSTNSIESAE